MTALVINCVVGSGIFGIPSELTRLVGWLSPLAMIAGVLAQLPLIASTAEVASQFSQPGGAYLYARTLFGRFAGIQVGWFSLLAPIAGVAANAGLFVTYLGALIPGARDGVGRAVALALLVAFPTAANYFGVSRGGRFSSVLVLAKMLPMIILIGLGLTRMVVAGATVHPVQLNAPGASEWITALLLLAFAYGGYEDALVPAGEVRDPRRTMGFALGVGLLACTVLYTLLQLVTVATIGLSTSDSPLTEVASVLMGSQGAMFACVEWRIPDSAGKAAPSLQHSRRFDRLFLSVGMGACGNRDLPVRTRPQRRLDDGNVRRHLRRTASTSKAPSRRGRLAGALRVGDGDPWDSHRLRSIDAARTGSMVVDVGDVWGGGGALVLGESHRLSPTRRPARYGRLTRRGRSPPP
jgi:hypothetical protein